MISIFVWLSNFGIFLYCLVLSATVQMLKLHLKLLQILFQFQFSLLETEKTKKRVTSGSYQQQFLVNYLDTVHFQEYCCGRDITLQMGQRLEKENINKYQLSQVAQAQVFYFCNGPIQFSNGLCRKSERSSCVADGTNFGAIWMSKLLRCQINSKTYQTDNHT